MAMQSQRFASLQMVLLGGEKVHLFNILQGYYGTPIISGGTLGTKGGEAEDIIISFSKSGGSDISSKNINDVEIVPFWHTGYVDIKKSMYFYPNIDSDQIIPLPPEDYVLVNNFIQARVKQLNLTFKNWDLIADKNPILVIERYRPTKRSSPNNNGQDINLIGNRKAQFIKPHNRINEIPITGETMENIQFEQETYFGPVTDNINTDEPYVKSRGMKKSPSQSAFQIIQFKIKTDDGISKPLLTFKLTASLHKKSAGQNFNQWRDDDTPEKNHFINISYRF